MRACTKQNFGEILAFSQPQGFMHQRCIFRQVRQDKRFLHLFALHIALDEYRFSRERMLAGGVHYRGHRAWSRGENLALFHAHSSLP